MRQNVSKGQKNMVKLTKLFKHPLTSQMPTHRTRVCYPYTNDNKKRYCDRILPYPGYLIGAQNDLIAVKSRLSDSSVKISSRVLLKQIARVQFCPPFTYALYLDIHFS